MLRLILPVRRSVCTQVMGAHEPNPEAKAGICYVETKSLDGETNLKIRQVKPKRKREGFLILFPIPFISFALLLFYILPDRNSDPESHSRLPLPPPTHPPSPHYCWFVPSFFIARRLEPFLPSFVDSRLTSPHLRCALSTVDWFYFFRICRKREYHHGEVRPSVSILR